MVSKKLFLRICLRSGFSPNQVTIFSGACGLVGAYMLSLGYLGLAFALVNIYALLDLVDGDIARVRKMQTNFGYWLDIFFDKLIDASLILGLVLLVATSNSSMVVTVVGCLLMGSVFFNQFILLLNDTTFKDCRGELKKSHTAEFKAEPMRLLQPVKFLKLHGSLNHNAFLFFIIVYPLIFSPENGLYLIFMHSVVTLILNVVSNFSTLRGQ